MDPDPDTRVRVAQILAGNRDPRAVDALHRAYATADPPTQLRLRPFIPKK
ncbi:MAG: hypothetical protein KIT31_43580 [Deltaproteobacteria bacterium]|nr:hypothetical protein [Deltaproteobacteria bacterium]